MKHSLKEAVNKQMSSVQLSTGQLKKLDVLQTSVPEQSQHFDWWYSLFGVAAMVMLTVLFLPDRIINRDSGLMINEIAMEVVKNHLHQKPLEIKGNQLSSIRDYFTRLDFAPVESEFLQSKDISLIGGRYCSLQGITAAQLRFKSISKKGVNTLYQVNYDPNIFKSLPDFDNGEEPVSVYSSGIKVTIWVEKGVLFALTED
jgi:hypothetical protein